MGWMSRRAMQGNPVGGTKGQSMKDKGPLRNILYVKYHAESIFEQDYVMLECGHEGYASGKKRARCKSCKDEANKPKEQK